MPRNMMKFFKIYNDFKKYLQARLPRLYSLVEKYKLIIKYIIAGSTAAGVDLTILYGLTEWVGLYYLLSATLAFIIAFFVSFNLQKFWTFKDNRRVGIHRQMTIYFLNGIINLNLNALFMYLLVDYVHIMYILAQIITSIFLAFTSFMVYRFVIFKKKNERLNP